MRSITRRNNNFLFGLDLDLDNFFNFNTEFLFNPPFKEYDAAKIDIKEYDDKVEVIAEIPGFTKEDVTIEYEKGHLTITGELKKDATEETGKFLHKEIGSRSFARKFNLGDAFDVSKIDATFEAGILNIILPKSEKEKSRKITIK